MRPSAILVLALLASACGETQAEEQGLPLPAPELRPMQAVLETQAAGGPRQPEPERMAELLDMLDGAFRPGRTGGPLAARILRTFLQDRDASWALQAVLDHEEPEVRSRAAYELGRLGVQASILPLLLRLKYEKDPGTFCWLAQALHALGNDAGLPYLKWVMTLPDHAERAGGIAIDVCRAAGTDPGDAPTWAFLGERLDAIYRHWRDTGVALREPPLEAPVPTPATEARIAAHLAVLQGFQLRPVDEAKFVLARLGVLAVPQLVAVLQAEEPYLRTVALELIAEIGRPARVAATRVLPLLRDPLTACYASRALGAVGAGEALPHLLQMLRSEDVERRAAAAGALGPLGDASVVPTLEALLADGSEALDVRVQAAFSLALFELERPAYRFLQRLRAEGTYHEATLDELLQKIDERQR